MCRHNRPPCWVELRRNHAVGYLSWNASLLFVRLRDEVQNLIVAAQPRLSAAHTGEQRGIYLEAKCKGPLDTIAMTDIAQAPQQGASC